MSTMLGLRKVHRSASIGVGAKDLGNQRVTFVNLDNKRVQRDLARHATLGQFVQANPSRFQLDTGTVELGGVVTPRTGSLVLDVTGASLLSVDGTATRGTSAAGTVTVTPNATNPLIAAIGLDTTTFATPTLAAVLAGTAAAVATEARSLSFVGSLPAAQLPAIDSTANRTWLALVWVPPSIATLTSVAGTGVFTTGSAHGYVVGDQVWLSGLTGGTGLVANALYTVATVPSATTFTLTNGTHSTNVTAGTVQRQIQAVDVLDTRP